MKNELKFCININASAEKVWDILWSDETYRDWTSVFIPGSYYKGEFKEGNDILFLSPGEHGLFAVVEKLVPFKSMYFKHFGLVLDGKPQDKSFGDDAIECQLHCDYLPLKDTESSCTYQSR